jgi:hypothetical protein
VLLEITAWSWRFVPHLIDWGGYGGDVASLQHAASFWSGNYRLPVEVPNTNLFTLAPAINGYDPLYVARAHHVLRSPPAYDPQLRLESVAVESHRGNLFLKRSLWLASQYVDGPLPAAGSLFPAATTVFLRDPPDHLPVKRVAAGALPASSVSKQARQTPLNPKTFRRRADAHSVSLTLPEIGCPRVHGALVMRYETDSRVRVETSFHSSDGLAALGKAFAVTPTNGGARRLEIPLPDLLRLRVRIDATSVDPSEKAPGFAITAAHVACDLADEDRRIRILFRGANSVRVELAGLPGPRILTFLDPHYPGWRARLDGEPVPILLANDAFKAVVVPAGGHEVEFVFRPTRVYAGMTISLASTLGAVVLVWRLRERTVHSA